jgi:alginate O-acetyltransferase complex protein AlgI
MTSPSPEFLVFALLLAGLLQIGRGIWWRRTCLLAANLYFLSTFSHDIVSFLPYAAFLALGFAAVRLQQADRAKVALVAAVLLLFVWLKRYAFFPESSLLPFPYFLLGLSYVFFRVLHLVIDAAPSAPASRIGFISYLNYALDFTCITCGPIQRYEDYRRTEQQPAPMSLVAAGTAVERIIVGYFKVAIVSVVLWGWQHDALAALSVDQDFCPRMAATMAIVMIYPLYLYFNFSGYIDFVIGVGRFLGFELPENFNRPFSSTNFLDFWSRWHITLSSWLKTYVYNPLLMGLMSRFSGPLEPFFGVLAFFVTFFLVGVWHGQTSMFAVFGLLQGGGVAANKLYQIAMIRRLGRKEYRALCAGRIYTACSRGLTITWFGFTLIWFWSSWEQVAHIVSAAGLLVVAAGLASLFVLNTIVLSVWEALRAGSVGLQFAGVPVMPSRYTRTMWNTALCVVLVATTLLLNQPAPDIVYKAF